MESSLDLWHNYSELQTWFLHSICAVSRSIHRWWPRKCNQPLSHSMSMKNSSRPEHCALKLIIMRSHPNSLKSQPSTQQNILNKERWVCLRLHSSVLELSAIQSFAMDNNGGIGDNSIQMLNHETHLQWTQDKQTSVQSRTLLCYYFVFKSLRLQLAHSNMRRGNLTHSLNPLLTLVDINPFKTQGYTFA